MKNLLIILFFSFHIIGFSQNDPKSEKYTGFEIYLVEDFKSNNKSYLNFNKKEIRKFKRYFKNKRALSNIPDTLCANYINLDKITLEDKPFLTLDDIQYYIKDNYTIVLSESGIKKMKEFKPDLFGSPFIIVAKDKKNLPCWFRPSYSSQSIDRIYVTTNISSSFNDDGMFIYKTQTELKLNFIGCGTDLRNSSDFINELKLIEE